MNPREQKDFRWAGGTSTSAARGEAVAGYVNLDLFPCPAWMWLADAEAVPFPGGILQRVECDAVLEHVRDPCAGDGGNRRVLAPGGYIHLVTPFCHPFHEYPKDYRRSRSTA